MFCIIQLNVTCVTKKLGLNRPLAPSPSRPAKSVGEQTSNTRYECVTLLFTHRLAFLTRLLQDGRVHLKESQYNNTLIVNKSGQFYIFSSFISLFLSLLSRPYFTTP